MSTSTVDAGPSASRNATVYGRCGGCASSRRMGREILERKGCVPVDGTENPVRETGSHVDAERPRGSVPRYVISMPKSGLKGE